MLWIMSTSSNTRPFVVGVDYSDHSIVAVDEALRLAAAAPGTRLVPVLVLPGGPVTEPREGVEMTSEVVSRSEENLVQLLEGRARALGLQLPPIEPRVRFGGAAERLIGEAKELQAGLIAVGTHGRKGLSHLFLGSVAEEVMRQAPCSVLIARTQAAGGRTPSDTEAKVAASRETLAATGFDADDNERGRETMVVTEPHIDADRVVLHVLDAPSGQVFVCAFEDVSTVLVLPLEGDWVPAPPSDSRARVAHTALAVAERDLGTFSVLFDELARRRARGEA
jgi:nucleotide-binding universal stress UspA family protein